MSALLPGNFADLEKFAGWALATSTERNRMRRATPMAEITAFYNAMLPRLKEVLAYLDRFSLREMPQDAQGLLYLALALAEITIAAELFHEPKVTGGCDPERFVVMHEIEP